MYYETRIHERQVDEINWGQIVQQVGFHYTDFRLSSLDAKNISFMNLVILLWNPFKMYVIVKQVNFCTST
jgi:hypothetical protein